MKLTHNASSALATSLGNALAQCATSDTAFYFKDREYRWQDVSNTISSLDQLLRKQPLGDSPRVAFIARSRPMHISCLWGLLISDRCASMIHCYQSTAKIINDIRKEGYRAWTHKLNFPASPEGRWQVRVVTEAGQMIGVLRFDVVAATAK